MSCQNVQERVSWFLDRRLAESEREDMSAHLETCPTCRAELQSMEHLRGALRTLARPKMPAGLAMQLRVLASHERSRRLSRASLPAFFRHCSDRAELLFDNLARPMALPFAGGVLSALLLFGMLVPSLSFRHNFNDDVQFSISSEPEGWLVEALPGAEGPPTSFWKRNYPEPRMDSANAVGSTDETVLELTIDDTGRVADYSVSHGQLTPEMQSIILLSRFTPATFGGRSTWGKKRFVFFSRRRNVRG